MSHKVAVSRLPPIGSSQAHGISPRAVKRFDGLTGPQYTIGSNKAKYHLPPPTVLRPYQDTHAGALETWPAHATGNANSSTSVALTKDKQLVVYDEEASGKPPLVPKPKFLDQLETFLRKELKSLGLDTVEPSDLRLQAYREVFEYLIEDFKTYKPLLASIKNEYEMIISHQREQIRQLEPLKQMLVTVSEQCDQKIMSLRDVEKQELLDLKQENKALYKRIDDLRQDHKSLEEQRERLQEELAAEYLRYRNEYDARKLLVSDINELRYQQEDVVMAKKAMQEQEDNKEDPVTLKIALKKAREDESAATKRLNDMVANYGDVIPRRDYEGLEKTYATLEEKVETMKGDYVTLKDEHDTLLGTYKQVLQERDDYYFEYENLRNKALTPRPSWDKCADHVAGGIVRWKEISEGKKSDELVDVLMAEMSGSSAVESAGVENFEGRGTGPEIPAYLQFEGQVRNRRLGKRDCALLIKDIWREKAAHDGERTDGTRDLMSNFLHTYLQRRFGLEHMVVEWGYNLHDACQRYMHDDRIGLFFGVLENQADEQVYYANLQIFSDLQTHLTNIDVERGNQGSLLKEDFKAALQDFFNSKDFFFAGKEEENLLTLVRAAETELDARGLDTLEYKNLFLEDDEGKKGPFLEELRKQMKAEKELYLSNIKDALGDITAVSVDDLQKALTMVDSYIKRPALDDYLCWAFAVEDNDKLDEASEVPLNNLLTRLQNGNVRKHSQQEP